MTSERWIDESDVCFITGKIMSTEDLARFTWEFDAWVSEEGQKIIEEDARGENPSIESKLIFREWYALDAAAAAREDDDG